MENIGRLSTRDTHVSSVVGAESNTSAVSWGAVIAGAFIAAALSLILLALGSGLGLSSVSPWDNAGTSARTIGFATIIWLAVMAAIANGVGGFVAGRLRTKWVDIHSDEVHFRDTAHGFLVWAVGAVVTAALLTSAANSLVGSATKMATLSAGGVAAGAVAPAMMQGMGDSMAPTDSRYFIDRMFRSEQPSTTPAGANLTTESPNNGGTGNNGTSANGADASMRGEIGRIFATGMKEGTLASADRSYVAKTIAARAGISQADAEKRVDEATTQLKAARQQALDAVDSARKAAAYTSIWVVVAFLIGAFSASIAATVGGRMRDSMSTM